MAERIERVKVLLGIQDKLQDALLAEIEDNTVALFKAITGDITVPEAFEFMIREVMVKRYNRIGSEGMSQERQSDMTLVFDKSDFNDYMDILNSRYKPPDERERGGVFWR